MVEINDEPQRKKVDILIKKVGEIDSETEENVILREFFVESLLSQLHNLKSFDKENVSRKFNTET